MKKLTKYQLTELLKNVSIEGVVRIGKDVPEERFEVVISDYPYKAKFFTDGTLSDFKQANYNVSFMLQEVLKRKGMVDENDLENLKSISREVERVKNLMLTLSI